MQVVIEIPEGIYNHIKNTYRTKRGSVPYSYIAWGTPLPKGHGRLIDADVVVDGFEDNYELCIAVNSTPTIIEADKESE